MREAEGNLWEYPADARVVTTNASVKKNGEAVMGKGVAKEAAERYRWLPRLLGDQLQRHGAETVLFDGQDMEAPVVCFPVKRNWWDQADLSLIAKSAHELVKLACKEGWQTVVIPRVGAGAGRLSWSDVRAVLAPILDDRFVAITFPKKTP
jgi:O-acetyl-ADP-ribose deacetylase (regulator of RNase III)